MIQLKKQVFSNEHGPAALGIGEHHYVEAINYAGR